jgi:glutamine amidotransferase
MENVSPGEAVYFVDSFMAVPEDEKHIIAGCQYGDHLISATIGRENVSGCQFHLEKSGTVGLNILRKYLEEI